MSDIFISYSQVDREFICQLRRALAKQGEEVWIDWEAVPISPSWWNDIQKGISKADNVVMILTPNSMASPICLLQIEYARQLKKFIIPVYHAEYDRETCLKAIASQLANPDEIIIRESWGSRKVDTVYDVNDSELKRLKHFFFDANADFEKRFNDLFKMIRSDAAHKEQHTTLELRALEWNRRGRDISFLLRHTELAQAQKWLKTAERKRPQPINLHDDYIRASEKHMRQRRTLRVASLIAPVIAGIVIALAVGAFLVGAQATTQAINANDQFFTATYQQGIAAQKALEAATQVARANDQMASANIRWRQQ